MAKMQADRVQMALVIDEYGGTEGLVSLEDIVETVVGDIEDEHDEDEEAMIQKVADGVWVADPRVPVEEVEEAVGTDFQLGDLAEEVDTLGGLVFTLVGTCSGARRAARRPRVSRLRVRGARRRPAPHQASADPGAASRGPPHGNAPAPAPAGGGQLGREHAIVILIPCRPRHVPSGAGRGLRVT